MALAGKKMVFTGTLEMKRAEAADLAKGVGASIQGSVSASTDIVVAGPDAVNTAKCIAAKAKGVTIWTEADFKKALGGRAAKPAAMAVAPMKRPSAEAAPAESAPAKRTKTAPSVDSGKPLAGQVFYRSGSHNYQKVIGEYIVALGGKWTKNANQATYCFDGSTLMRESYHFAKPYVQSIEGDKPIICVPLNFTRGSPTAEDTKSLLKAMRGAETLLSKVKREGMSSETIAAMYRKEFKNWFPQYYNDIKFEGKSMYENFHKSFEKANRKGYGSYGVLVNSGGKLKFEIRKRGNY